MANENHGSSREEAALMSHSPSTSHQNQPSSPKPARLVQDLPDELVQAGWEKCWSKRENRPYYFNRFTNQSLWEMPLLGQHDVISDPLGLNAAPGPAEGGAGEAAAAESKSCKRRLSEEGQPSGNLAKKSKVTWHCSLSDGGTGKPHSSASPKRFQHSRDATVEGVGRLSRREAGGSIATNGRTVGGASCSKPQLRNGCCKRVSFDRVYWDLDIQTNAVIKQRAPSEVLPPHPEVELLRSQLMLKLRQHYRELCQQREGIDPPRESFNRWMLERKVVDKGSDPLLPSSCEPIVSPSMFREIMNDIPIRLSRIKFREEAKRLLFKYAEAAKRLIESSKNHHETPIGYLGSCCFKEYLRDIFARWLDRLEHLRKQCGPHVSAAAKDSVEGICSKIYHISLEYVKRIREKHLALLKEHNISGSCSSVPVGVGSLSGRGCRILGTNFPSSPAEVEPPDVQDRLVYCYPLRLTVPSPALPSMEMHVENSLVCVRYKGEVVKVSRSYFSKLWLLYRYSCIDDASFEHFLPRVWCLLRRYQMMFGIGLHEGTGLQGALPVHVFEALHKHFGVSFECFASPLNCYFKQYCSAFLDTDGYFGSRGPCLDFFPISGSFQANPPFCEELMDVMVTHFEKLLEGSSEPLSFIVFIPEWRDPPPTSLTRMEQSRFKRQQLVLPAFDHEYRSGAQHLCKKEEMYYKAVHNTAVLFLQNNAGFSKWEPTQERLHELLTAYKHSGRAQAPPAAPSASDKDPEPVREQQSSSRESTPN
ncbi:hypothetical protein Chor_010506 [Crotalus horridus]